MYLILSKYFYFLYYFKKEKKSKFFLLIDIMFFLMKKCISLFILRKKYNKIRNLIIAKKNKLLSSNKYSLNTKEKIKKHYFSVLTAYKYLNQFIKLKISEINDFIIHFLPEELLPLGNRKRYYNLINKKFKRFFLLMKKKFNKKFFFYYLIRLFRKIKDLFIKSDPFIENTNTFFNFFSSLFFNSEYKDLSSLYSRQTNRTRLKNKIRDFFQLVFYFSKRIDYYLVKTYPFISITKIRQLIQQSQIKINNKMLVDINYFIKPNSFIHSKNNIFFSFFKQYVFHLQDYFNTLNNRCYKEIYNIKYFYYLALYKLVNLGNRSIINKSKYYITFNNKLRLESSNLEQKNISLFYYYSNFFNFNSLSFFLYEDVIINIYFYFVSSSKYKEIYNLDNLEEEKMKNNLSYNFPFISKYKEFSYSIVNSDLIMNISFNFSHRKMSNQFIEMVSLLNYLKLFFFFSKTNNYYYTHYKNSHFITTSYYKKTIEENKNIFYYLSNFYQLNLTPLL